MELQERLLRKEQEHAEVEMVKKIIKEIHKAKELVKVLEGNLQAYLDGHDLTHEDIKHVRW